MASCLGTDYDIIMTNSVFIRNERGSMLIQAILSMAMLGIIGTMYASMMNQMGRSQQILSQKLEQNDLKMSMMASLISNEVCGWQFAGKTLPDPAAATGSPESKLAFDRFYLGLSNTSPLLATVNQKVPGSTTGQSISDLYLSQIAVNTSPTDFTGKIFIAFSDANGATITAPVSIGLRISTDASRKIISCGLTSPVSQSSETVADNSTLAKLGNCDSVSTPTDGMNTYTPQQKTAAIEYVCSTMKYPVPASGIPTMVSSNSSECLAKDGSHLASGAFLRAYGLKSCSGITAAGFVAIATGSPMVAGLKSKDECLKLPFSPQGATVGRSPFSGYIPEKICISGRWVSL